MENHPVIFGVLMVLCSIIMGAFGAHYFSQILSEARLNSLKTGINYQMYMGLGLLAIGSLKSLFSDKSFLYGTRCIILGALLFSLSIYGLVYLGHNDISAGKSILGPATPIGGTILIIGWGILFFNLLKNKSSLSDNSATEK